MLGTQPALRCCCYAHLCRKALSAALEAASYLRLSPGQQQHLLGRHVMLPEEPAGVGRVYRMKYHITPDDLRQLQQGHEVERVVGCVAGYPWFVELIRCPYKPVLIFRTGPRDLSGRHVQSDVFARVHVTVAGEEVVSREDLRRYKAALRYAPRRYACASEDEFFPCGDRAISQLLATAGTYVDSSRANIRMSMSIQYLGHVGQIDEQQEQAAAEPQEGEGQGQDGNDDDEQEVQVMEDGEEEPQ